ncbi:MULTISPECIES: nucleotidyltransferase family protein [unclassified Marinitoga]|uniref:nucleotidyltransferase family protein n=1 Tax=unclassified Marinitoga TaxID=2640159 RepID=UPI0006412BF7|nr:MULTISPECIES: nucleotidyltransferase family protein [unclassified Marinitoga]KLO24251.1 hypothetical protein X274_04145 [Marinitoga sp. 1155]NUV00433.1 hypothetical protein [Marinitoga sp. 1154]
MKILGVILAAGLSTRFKDNKLLFEYNGKALLQWTIDLLNKFDIDKLMIVNEKWKSIKKNFDYNNFKIIENPDYKNGISSSVKEAIKFALKYDYESMLIFLGDMPLIPKTVVTTILNSTSEKPIIAPYYKDKKGFPTLIKKPLFYDILNIHGDSGVKQIIKNNPEFVEKINVDYPEVTVDFDYKLEV